MSGKTRKIAWGTAGVSLTTVALAMGVSSGASVASPVATAHSTKVDATDYTLSCTSITTKIDIGTALTTSGSGGPTKVTMKLGIQGCTASPPPAGGPAVSVKSAKGTLTFSLPNNSCQGFIDGGGFAGTMTMKFVTPSGAPKLSPTTTQIQFGSYSGSVDANGDLSLAFPGTAVGLPAVQVTGPFAGLDGGASSHLTITDGTFMTRKLECGDPKGLKSLTFGDGSLSLG